VIYIKFSFGPALLPMGFLGKLKGFGYKISIDIGIVFLQFLQQACNFHRAFLFFFNKFAIFI